MCGWAFGERGAKVDLDSEHAIKFTSYQEACAVIGSFGWALTGTGTGARTTDSASLEHLHRFEPDVEVAVVSVGGSKV